MNESTGNPASSVTQTSQTPTAPNPSKLRSRFTSIGRFGLVAFCLLSTFAFLTSGMSSLPPSDTDVDPTSTDETSVAAPVSYAALTKDPERMAIQAELSRLWEEQIEASGLAVAPAANWLTVCRRLSLAMVGSGLSLEEIRNLESLPENERIVSHREALLVDPRFHDYWGERFTRFYVGADNGPFLVYRRRRFRTWLSEQFAAQTPYDVLVRRLITANGLWTDRPEVNFYTVTFDSGNGQPDPIRMAARTCRAFLGIRIDCLQCHDDFLGNVSMGNPEWMGGDGDFREGTQQDFHSLAAFFTAAKNKGLRGLQSRNAYYQYQYLNETEEQDVAPNVPFMRELLERPAKDKPVKSDAGENGPSGSSDAVTLIAARNDAEDQTGESNEPLGSEAQVANDNKRASREDQRERLARWITHPNNVQFSRAFVTRVWTLMFGCPPSGAVDDLPLNEDPSPLILKLSREFIESGYDIRHLIRMITDTPAFRVDSQSPDGDDAFEITARHERSMAVFPIVRLRAEQVAGAAIQSGRVKTLDRETSLFLQFQQFQEGKDFLRRYGDLGEDEFDNDTATITQRLTMLNGKLTSEVSKWNPILNTSSHVGMFAADNAKVVESLYLATLNRYPSPAESDHFVKRIEEGNGRRNAIIDIVWVLLNSSEFAWNH
ncbi:DUF1553 domain-containing protein [Aporhodopirellula aestuarii]|uniref:DUF1549 and DUF1553 domain-containing protein n=1 Tax=Aporhodopirellula aestuarii TaxID=2950107 RepID=A0ABT0TY31_9BACT|nr:DUF1553 domain-containing protein [Aporhodopirellula aestuarii]MCM2369513.1 DUF1549 and DUF1553 domain-containing protein [Aporhodopirellula aestuarii]